MTNQRWLYLAAVSLALAGAVACGGTDPGTPADSGTPDSGTPDSGTPDSGTPDSGTPDSGTPDSGTPDSGTPDSGTPDSGTPDGGTPDGGTDAGTDGGTDGGVITAECDKAANVAKASALVAAQPVLGVKTKAVITANTTFASVAGDASVNCTVSLKFKDSNGNGTLEAYEDWTKSADVRTADLAARMSSDQKLALMAHASTTDVPAGTTPTVAAALQAAVTAGIRFGAIGAAANNSSLTPRATWANSVQALAEAASLGIPFVLSTEPVHSTGNGRAKARGFSSWPQELGLAASGDLTLLESFGKIVATEYRAIGITLALSPSADLATEPRWFNNQFSFGEDSATVASMVGAYVKGLQGATLGKTSVAAVVGHFPGAGPADGGWDARLEKGKYTVYPGNKLDQHLAAFQSAFDNGVAGVMPGYGIPKTGPWTALGGLLNGATIEQVGAPFNKAILTDALRTHYSYTGLVLAPIGALEDKGVSPLGAPWGMESSTKAQRIGKAVGAGVDQFAGLNDTTALAAAKSAALITDAQIDASAKRALKLIFQLGLFENPYVDPAQAPVVCNSDAFFRAGLDALNRSMVLIVNKDKPAGWLNGDPLKGDGSQSGDKGNAGNGSRLVLPAPPGEPYVAAGCAYYIGAGNIDYAYVDSVSTGYGELTNAESCIGPPPPAPPCTPVVTNADRMAVSDYVFIRISAPYTQDPDSGPLNYCKSSLEYTSAENAAVNSDLLQPVRDARAAINARPGSNSQIIVGVDAGRASVVSELIALGVSGIYLEWGVSDKVFLDVAFGIKDGRGKLPVGLPLSDAAAQSQQSDVAGDGQHATFVKGAGFQTNAF